MSDLCCVIKTTHNPKSVSTKYCVLQPNKCVTIISMLVIARVAYNHWTELKGAGVYKYHNTFQYFLHVHKFLMISW